MREKIIRSLGDELPHETYVSVETKAMEEKMLSIGVIIYVARDSQKSIVIGHQGSNLKRIGQQTRLELEKMLNKKVMLKTFVKVNKNWNNDAQYLSSLGVGSQSRCLIAGNPAFYFMLDHLEILPLLLMFSQNPLERFPSWPKVPRIQNLNFLVTYYHFLH